MFEARPDIFPEGYLTDTELDLWGYWYEDREQRAKSRRKH